MPGTLIWAVNNRNTQIFPLKSPIYILYLLKSSGERGSKKLKKFKQIPNAPVLQYP